MKNFLTKISKIIFITTIIGVFVAWIYFLIKNSLSEIEPQEVIVEKVVETEIVKTTQPITKSDLIKISSTKVNDYTINHNLGYKPQIIQVLGGCSNHESGYNFMTWSDGVWTKDRQKAMLFYSGDEKIISDNTQAVIFMEYRDEIKVETGTEFVQDLFIAKIINVNNNSFTLSVVDAFKRDWCKTDTVRVEWVVW